MTSSENGGASDLDVRGWEVVAADGRRVGTVRELLDDPRSPCGRSLMVAVEERLARAAGRVASIGADAARPDADTRTVRLLGITAAQVVALPEYAVRVLHAALADAAPPAAAVSAGTAAPAAPAVRRPRRPRARGCAARVA